MSLCVSHLVKGVALCSMLIWTLSVHAESVVVTVSSLEQPPKLDGQLGDWLIEPQIIRLHKAHPGVSVALSELTMWAGHFDDSIYFAFRWADAHPDRQHKPYIWSDEKERYTVGPQREDRLAIQFQIEGEYDVNWLSGNSFKADMWHWKSSRSAPIGLAHDKMTIVGREKVIRSFKAEGVDGEPVYIRRISDSGDKLYTHKRYGLKESKQMPKYLLNANASGSIADVKAAQRWRDGAWTVELTRKLNTHHDDDVLFQFADDIPGGIAVFNRSGDSNHVISNNLLFRLER